MKSGLHNSSGSYSKSSAAEIFCQVVIEILSFPRSTRDFGNKISISVLFLATLLSLSELNLNEDIEIENIYLFNT